MIWTRKVFLAATALLLAVAPAFAQRIEVQPKGVVVGRGDLPLLSTESVEKLKLTADQKDKYTKIEAEYKEKAKGAQEKFRTDIAGLNDRAKYREVFEKFQEDTKKAREDSLAKVEPILTADQKAVFTQVKGLPVQPGAIGGRPVPIQIGGGIGQVLPPGLQQRLQLTEDQKKEIEKLQKEVEGKILKILNDEQRKQLEQFKKTPIRIQPIQPQPANPRIQPAVPNIRQTPDVKKD